MISKQEAMVQIGQLQLFDCSESIDTHSLSGYTRIPMGSMLVQHCLPNMPTVRKDMK